MTEETGMKAGREAAYALLNLLIKRGMDRDALQKVERLFVEDGLIDLQDCNSSRMPDP